MTDASTISANIAAIRHRIRTAAAESARQSEDITLIAVSKTRSAEEIAAAAAAGITDVGESYLQEALDKQAHLAALPLCWHFIGPIQSNKSRAIAEHFDWVHSVDRLKIARRLNDQRPSQRSKLNICLQVNISGESSKSGLAPAETLAVAKAVAALPRLALRGLMAIPAATDDFDEQRESFAALRALLHALREALPEAPLDQLSMGMSGDMEAAIVEGATLLRIGSDLFGPRA